MRHCVKSTVQPYYHFRPREHDPPYTCFGNTLSAKLGPPFKSAVTGNVGRRRRRKFRSAVAEQQEKKMKYILETPKSVEQAVADLQAAVQRHKFGVLHIHNLQETLKKKGVDFPNAFQILEICNPQTAKEVLTEDMDLNMSLPCRVSVYSEGGKTKIGMMKPSAMLKALSDSPALARVAQEVEETIIEMIAEAK